MNASQPPRLATWLLQRWGSGPRRASLIGDLIEQYQLGRSPAWYWRQVLTAIVVGAFHDVRAHKLLAVRAVVASYLFMVLAGFLAKAMYDSVGVLVWNWTVTHGWDAARIWWFGRYRWPNQPSNPVLVMESISPIVTGWAIARFHRRHSSAMVLSCAVFWFLVVAATLPWLHDHTGQVISWRPIGWRPMIRYIPMAAAARMMVLFNLVSVPPKILLGGLWGSRPDPDAPDQIVIGG